jgi:ABC-type branched-subunit amino acid transport system substrate-binding protein
MLLLVNLLTIATSYHLISYKPNASISTAIQTNLEKLKSKVDITILDSVVSLSSLSLESTDLIIVCESTEIESFYIKTLSSERGIPALFLSQGEPSESTFYLKQSPGLKAEALSRLLQYLRIGTFAFTWPYSNENERFYQKFKDYHSISFNHLSISQDMPVDQVSGLFIRIFKSQGLQSFVFLGHEDLCLKVHQGFLDSKMNKEGSMGLYLDECIYQVQTEGSLFLVPAGLESSNSKTDYLEKQLQPFFNVFNKKGLTSFQIQQFYSELSKNSSYSLINIQNSTFQQVGKISSTSLSLTLPIIYYSGVSNRSLYPESRITISANTGTFNPNAPPVFHNKRYHEGTYFGVEKINRDKSLFPNHDFFLYDEVDCGVSVFDFNYSKTCILKHYPKMGHAYIPTVTFINTNLLDQMASMQLRLPFIAGILSAAPLSNKTRFPTFVRIVSPASLFSRAWSNLINIYGWKKIVMHYANDSFGIASYETLNKSALTQGYEIINEEKYRMINNILSNESIAQYYEHMKKTISLGCNIIFLGMGDPSAFFWLEGMYDMGARRGDFTFIFFTTTGLDAFSQPTGNSMKRKELMHGSFVVYNAAWVGDYGKGIREEFLKSRNVSWCRSYNVDAVYTAAKTTQFLLDQGKSYEDHQVFNSAMRLIRFQGATGVISFDSSSNDRNIFYFNLFNFYEDDQGNWHDDEIALISPLGSVYFQSLKEGVWPTGGIPKDMKEDYKNCGFMEKEIQESQVGKNIKIVISIILLAIVIVLTLYTIKRLKYYKLSMMHEKCYAMFEDYLTLGFIFVESLQIISIGPSFSDFNEVLSNISEVISLNYLQRAFWVIFLVLLSVTAFWLVFLLSSFKKFYCGIKSIKRKLNAIKPYTIPIMSNYLFLPIIVSLFSILMCDKSIGKHLTDSYLNYDCTVRCWKMPHLIYVIVACIEVVSYVPIAILYRTLWQIEQLNINIKIDSLYLVVRNMNVVILVVISKILKEDYPVTHSIIYLMIQISVLLFILALKHPFNYDRANLWCKTMSISVIWNTIVCIISQKSNIKPFILIGVQLGGWFLFFTITVILQSKLTPNLLVSKKGPEIKDLVMFSFGRKSQAESFYVNKSSNIDFENRSHDDSASG